MIIGIDASRANRQIKTGVEWYSYYLIEELKKITTGDKNQFFLYTDQPLKGELKKMPNNWQEKVLSWPLKYLWTKIRLSWEMIKDKPDILFIPSHVLPIFFPKKTIITIHDLAYERYPKAYSKFSRYYLRKNYKLAVRYAFKIIVPTEFTKKELINLYQADPEKIEVIHLGYNDKIFRVIQNQEEIDRVLKKYKIRKPYLLFVGRVETKKGVKYLFEAYLKLNKSNDLKLNLVLVGKPGYGYKEIKDLKLKIKNLIEIGYIDQKDLVYLYNGAEIFIFPSLYEGFGLPILEAMACGIPVIASDLEPIREILVGKYHDREKLGTENFAQMSAVLVPPENPEILAEKIKEVLENQELRQKMISKGLERVKNFSWQKCARETLKVLENMLK